MSIKSSRKFALPVLSTAIAVALSLGLAACGGKSGGGNAASAQSQQSPAEQQEIAKYNVYVEAANDINKSFADQLAEHVHFYGDALKSGKPLEDYSVPSVGLSEEVVAKVKKGLAMSPVFSDVDPGAKQFADALDKLIPINRELVNYADAKGYLSDNGQKARDKDAEYVAALEAAAKGEDAFEEGIKARDDKNIREAFEKAPKGTQAYYRAGTVVYARQVMKDGQAFFSSLGSAESAAAFKASLDKLNEMSDEWNKKVQSDGAAHCEVVTERVNGLLGGARDALKHAADGQYQKYDPNDPIEKLTNPIKNDADHLRLNYDNVIAGLNRTGFGC